MRQRYDRASKRAKTQMLSKFCQTTGYYRAAGGVSASRGCRRRCAAAGVGC
ncbi:MAG: hypothetical protein HY335_03305 [Deinococcus sp.]|nr:hypothetical protein [Deinococcus sp.]